MKNKKVKSENVKKEGDKVAAEAYRLSQAKKLLEDMEKQGQIKKVGQDEKGEPVYGMVQQ